MDLKNIIKTIKSIKNPMIFRKYILYKLISLLYRNNNGIYILDEEWDNLIILDACRYDFFEKIYKNYKIEGILEKKISRGTHTSSFLTENFKNKFYNDIIYITANPYVDILLKGKLFKIISLWKEEWDAEYHTVLPKNMYILTLNAIKKYPNKKIIIHFMQPHYPYIGYNLKFNNLETIRDTALKKKDAIVKSPNKKRIKENFFTLYSSYVYGMIDIGIHLRGYWKNLEYTFPYIEKLLKILPGITVITADHGEAFGEFIHPFLPIRYYGHRNGVRIPILVNVPWLTVKQENEDIMEKRSLLEKEIISNKIKFLKNLSKF
ncbi:MAG: hypothetical protein ACFFAA_03030 [Promethearchaeota archaeon]